MQHFLVLGAGSWGTAVAIYLARQGHAINLWGHNPQEMAHMSHTRANEHYLPGIAFPDNLNIIQDLSHAFANAPAQTTVLIMVPSHGFAALLETIQPLLKPTMSLLWGTKGLTHEGNFLHTLCEKFCPNYPTAVLSGPSFAKEVVNNLPTAVTIATCDTELGERLVQSFHSELFRVYLSTDIVGVQLGGAVKNVLAIAVGMSDGLGFGANARAALITRGLAELCRLGAKLGAQLPTLMGLAGVGDMVLTCTDNQSRNRRFGLALGQGQNAQAAEQHIGQVVEGKVNAKQVLILAQHVNIEMPICQQVHAVLFESISAQQAVSNLLTRVPKAEGF